MPTIEAKPGGRVYVAPGSGINDWSYGIELARQWPKADEIYERIKLATDVDIYEICQRPKEDPVTDPALAQPAALGIGYASAEFLKQEIGPPDYLVGLSAGEFTVACISGAIQLEKGALLSKRRGEYQNEAAGGKGGSAVVIMHDRLDTSRRKKRQMLESLASIPGVHIANDHTPKKLGIGFSMEAFDEGKLLETINAIPGVKRAIHNKGVAFSPHGKDVVAAQEKLAHLMARTIEVKNATVPIVANYTGRLMMGSRTVKHNLIWQTTSTTQLNRGMAYLISRGVCEYWDIGPDIAMKKLLGDFATLYNVEIKAAAELTDNPLQ